jgi:integrase
MKAALKSPCYLVRNPYSFCFRMIVPKDLRKFVGKTELRYTLRTGNLKDAKHKAKLLAGQVQLIFRCLRKERQALGKLSDDQIKQLVHQYIKAALDSWDKYFYEEFDDDIYPPQFTNAREFHSHLGFLDSFRQDLIDCLNLGDFSMLEETINGLLTNNGINPFDKSSLEYRKLCAEIHKAEIQLIPLEIRHMQCDFSYKKQLPDIFPDLFKKTPGKIGQTTASIAQNPAEEAGHLLSEVINKYVAENEKANWTEKSKQENESSLNLFLEVMGDVPVKSINRRHISEFKATLQKLPPNRNKVKKYRDKSIQQLLAMDIKKTLSVRTINKTLTRVGSLFKYALQEGFIEGQNPATEMNLPLGKFEDDNRAPFTEEELAKLMRSKEYVKDSHRRSYQFWIPIIALFTGMRQDEIAQLHLDDIRQDEEGIWLIDVNDRGEKKVKTKSARRLIPMHSFIISELKLPEYVERLKEEGETRLFPELKKGRDGYAKSVSRWFNEKYKVRCGIEKDVDGRMKDFHSYRKTLINHLQRKNVPFYKLKQVMGHSKGKDVTQAVYTEKYTPRELFDDVISKIDFGIDLSHLKNSKFVPN